MKNCCDNGESNLHANYVSALYSPSIIEIPQWNMMTVQPHNAGTSTVKKIIEKFL